MVVVGQEPHQNLCNEQRLRRFLVAQIWRTAAESPAETADRLAAESSSISHRMTSRQSSRGKKEKPFESDRQTAFFLSILCTRGSPELPTLRAT